MNVQTTHLDMHHLIMTSSKSKHVSRLRFSCGMQY